MDRDLQKSAKVFKALSDSNRLAVLELLQSGEKCACVLLEQLDLTQPGLSYHMKILCESGIVSSRQEGKWMYYRLNAEGREHAVDLLKDFTTPDAEQDVPCLCGNIKEAVG